jgi:hypothetical protein
MATLEVKVNDSFVPLAYAPQSVKIDLEWALMNKPEIVVTRTTPVEVRTCKVCEYAHEGLYCGNCFTGERVNVSTQPNRYKFSRVMKLTPNTCHKA